MGIIWCGTGRLSRINSSSSLPTISTAKYISKNWRSVCWPFAAQSQCLLLASLIHCSGTSVDKPYLTSVDKPYYTDRNYSHGIKILRTSELIPQSVKIYSCLLDIEEFMLQTCSVIYFAKECGVKLGDFKNKLISWIMLWIHVSPILPFAKKKNRFNNSGEILCY